MVPASIDLVMNLCSDSAGALCDRGAEDSRGAIMAEYGLLIALVAVGVLSALGLFHDELISFYVNATATAANQVNEGALVPAQWPIGQIA